MTKDKDELGARRAGKKIGAKVGAEAGDVISKIFASWAETHPAEATELGHRILNISLRVAREIDKP